MEPGFATDDAFNGSCESRKFTVVYVNILKSYGNVGADGGAKSDDIAKELDQRQERFLNSLKFQIIFYSSVYA